MKTLSVFCGLGLLLCFGPLSVAVEIGVAACDITPDVTRYEVPMAGYGARDGKPSTGVHDALQAKVLYVRDGETAFALVTTDLRSTTPELKDLIIEQSEGLDFSRENLMVAASHNHSGPSFYPQQFWQLQFGEYDPAILLPMADSIAGALRVAVESAQPARVGFAERELPSFTRNRRWGYDTEARESDGEVPQLNTRLWVMRVDTAGGQCMAILTNYGTHPTILGADNFLLTAEWPGVLQDELEVAFPGAVSLYTNGAEGDQAPAGAQGADGFERMEDFGKRLAREAAALVHSIETRPVDARYAYREASLGEPRFSEAARKGRYAFMHPMAMEVLPRFAVLQQFRIGDVVLAALPGEPIAEVGRATETAIKNLGAAHAVTVSLANDYVGYILNAKEYAHGGYEVDSRSYYGPGLGDVIVRETARSAEGLFSDKDE